MTTHLSKSILDYISNKAMPRRSNPASDWQLDTLINHEHKLIIYINAKCASGTIKTWFLQQIGVLPTDISGEADKFLGKSIHDYIKENYKLYCAPKKHNNNYTTAIVVRNPWRRVVSCYCNKILIKENHLKTLDISSKEDYEKEISFREFVNLISKIDHAHLEQHLRSQVFGREHIHFDYIIKMENLNADLSELSKNRGIQTAPLALDRRNPTDYHEHLIGPPVYDHKSSTFKHIPAYTSFYDKRLIDAVEKKYKADIKLFNYKFHD